MPLVTTVGPVVALLPVMNRLPPFTVVAAAVGVVAREQQHSAACLYRPTPAGPETAAAMDHVGLGRPLPLPLT